jgi:apoptosis-inducing factor 2
MSKTILILGGSYAGLTTAHSLLKSILPSHKDLRVILVNPSDHFFFNIPSVRAALPGQYENEKLYHSIPAGFAYAGESFEFVEGKAEKVDPASNSVTISTVSGQRVQPYNFLVVATGSSTIGKSPWMANGNSYHNTKKYLSDMSKKIAAAESIVVGGGGTTGAELAGELGYVYGGTKEITLVIPAH